jgi:hypothetical protein
MVSLRSEGDIFLFSIEAKQQKSEAKRKLGSKMKTHLEGEQII